MCAPDLTQVPLFIKLIFLSHVNHIQRGKVVQGGEILAIGKRSKVSVKLNVSHNPRNILEISLDFVVRILLQP